MPDAKGWFPLVELQGLKRRLEVWWVPTGDKRVEYTTHGDQMAEWRSVVTAQFPEYRSQINILRTTTSPAQAEKQSGTVSPEPGQTFLLLNILLNIIKY